MSEPQTEDPIQAVTHSDPYPYYAALTAQAPMLYERRLGLWLASSADAAAAVLSHPDCRVRPIAQAVPAAIAGGAAGSIFGALARMNDGARHAQPKMVLRQALAGLDPALVRQRAATLAARHGGLGHAGALNAWLWALPVQTVASLIGFGDGQLAALAAWMGDFAACLSPLSSAAQIAQAHAAALALLRQMAALTTAPAPGSLLAAVLAGAEAGGWDERQAILANLVGLLSQSYEATAGLIGNSIVALLRRPELAAALRAAPQRIGPVVAEVSRFDPAIQNTRRYAACATRVAGVDIEAGQTILVLLAAAGRDPRAHARAGEFWPERPAGPVSGFGHGPHACPGHALACTIAGAAIAELLRQPPAQGLEPGRLAWRYRPSVNARIPEFFHPIHPSQESA